MTILEPNKMINLLIRLSMIITLIFTTILISQAQKFNFKLKEHKISLIATIIQGASDGARDAAMFGRIKGGQWFNEDLQSWKLKYKDFDNGDKNAAFFGSKTIFAGFTDAPHGFNSISNFSGEVAKVWMPNLTNLKFGQKLLVVLGYSFVRSASHNLIYGLIFKQK